jgi:hypothetical protein
LYEAGASRMVRFDRPGISYIFCNIHPEMSAVVITIATSLYAISNQEGQISLADVPYGCYVPSGIPQVASCERLYRLQKKLLLGKSRALSG